jgi:hypothetical protein
MGAVNSATRLLPGAAEDYQEPATFEQIRDACADAILKIGEAKSTEEAQALGLKLAADTKVAMLRFQACYSALMHFAKHGCHMSNMKMVLTQGGRTKEPAGGTWLNGINTANLQPNEHLFYAAIDAVGRKAVEDAMVADFERIQAAAKLQAEKAAVAESSGLEGPIGGPVAPRVNH